MRGLQQSRRNKIIIKKQLDRQISLLLGANYSEVRRITKAFIEAVRSEVLLMNAVRLDGFGYLHPHKLKGVCNQSNILGLGRVEITKVGKFRVSFRKSYTFRLLTNQIYGIGKIRKI